MSQFLCRAEFWDSMAGELMLEPGTDALSRLGMQLDPIRAIVMIPGNGRLACHPEYCALPTSEVFHKAPYGTGAALLRALARDACVRLITR